MIKVSCPVKVHRAMSCRHNMKQKGGDYIGNEKNEGNFKFPSFCINVQYSILSAFSAHFLKWSIACSSSM